MDIVMKNEIELHELLLLMEKDTKKSLILRDFLSKFFLENIGKDFWISLSF